MLLNRKNVLLAAGTCALLAGCLGEDDVKPIEQQPTTPPPAAVTAVPDSAVASTSALVSYLKGQKADDETSESLTLPTVDVAVSETEEPQAL